MPDFSSTRRGRVVDDFRRVSGSCVVVWFVVFDYFVLVIINFCCVHVISCEHTTEPLFVVVDFIHCQF